MMIKIDRLSNDRKKAWPCFEFRVTLVQNHQGFGPLSNNGTGVIYGMIHFSADLLLSVGKSSTLTVKIKWTCIQGVSQSEVCPRVQDRNENFFEGGSNFTEDGSFGYLNYLR